MELIEMHESLFKEIKNIKKLDCVENDSKKLK